MIVALVSWDLKIHVNMFGKYSRAAMWQLPKDAFKNTWSRLEMFSKQVKNFGEIITAISIKNHHHSFKRQSHKKFKDTQKIRWQ